MNGARGGDAAVERLRKGRDLVRRTALLLSGGEPVDALFGRLAALLAEFVDASIVLVATSHEKDARIAFVFQDGSGGKPDDDAVKRGSTTESVLRTGTARVYAAADAWPNQNALALNGRALELPESAIFVPIAFGGATVGVLSVQSRIRAAYDTDDVALLETCALYLGARIAGARQREQSAEFERLASVDALTGLANRRAFDETVVREWRRCARAGEPIAIALLDVDYFKAFNDAYGHLAGDAALRQVARAILNSLRRSSDFAARYGGEEFALILPGTDAAGAVALCESIAGAIRTLGIPHQASSLGIATASIGAYATHPGTDEDPQAAVALADALLYRAKGAGRNRVVAQEYESQAPPAHPRAQARHNLPAPRSSFLGRESDVAMVGESLRRGRLVTISGAGGIGKTRLAIEVAREAVEAFAGGVWFVDLAPVADAELVVSTIARAAGADVRGASDPLAALADRLAAQRILLLLDNCEHLIGEIARVADRLLAACPNVSVLTTSREPLRIAGEALYRLEPLPPERAVELFRDRARDAGGTLDGEVAAAICSRLDGIALAIELAAARVRTLSPARILELLDDRFDLLREGNRALPARQQTLLASIAWSYALLEEREKRTFRRVGLLAGSFTAEAVRAIAFGGAGGWEAVDSLSELVDKSMVVAVDEVRYRLLDSMRDFAIAELTAAGETESAAAAHAEFFAAESGRMARENDDRPDHEWRARHRDDIDNFRAALDWAFSRGRDDLITVLVGNLHPYWNMSALDDEGMRRSEAALAFLGERAREPRFAIVWIAVAWCANTLLRNRRSLEAAETALELARAGGDELLEGAALRVIGLDHHRLGDDPALAEAALAQAVEINRRIGRPMRAVNSLIDHATSLLRTGDLERARIQLVEAADLARARGWPRQILDAEANLAEIEFALGNVDEACALARRCVEAYRNRPLRLTYANALSNLASYLCSGGHDLEAAERAREALSVARAFAHEPSVALAAQVIALCDARAGAVSRAAQLLGYADAVYVRRDAQREPTEASVRDAIMRELCARMAAASIERELSKGREFEVEDACRLALGA